MQCSGRSSQRVVFTLPPTPSPHLLTRWHPLPGRFSPVWEPNNAPWKCIDCTDYNEVAEAAGAAHPPLPETRCWALKLTLATCCWLAADKFRLPSTGNQWECYVNWPYPLSESLAVAFILLKLIQHPDKTFCRPQMRHYCLTLISSLYLGLWQSSMLSLADLTSSLFSQFLPWFSFNKFLAESASNNSI